MGGDLLGAAGLTLGDTADFSKGLSLFGFEDFGGWEGAWRNGGDSRNLFFEYTGTRQVYEPQYGELLSDRTA